VTSRPAVVGGCECRSRAALGATPGRCRGHRGLARARPSQWAGHGQQIPAAQCAPHPADRHRSQPQAAMAALIEGLLSYHARAVSLLPAASNLEVGHATTGSTIASRPPRDRLRRRWITKAAIPPIVSKIADDGSGTTCSVPFILEWLVQK